MSSHDDLVRLGATAFVSEAAGGERVTYRERGELPGRIITAQVERTEPRSSRELASGVRHARAVVMILNHPTRGCSNPRPISDRILVALRRGGDPVDAVVLSIIAGDAGSWVLEVGP